VAQVFNLQNALFSNMSFVKKILNNHRPWADPDMMGAFPPPQEKGKEKYWGKEQGKGEKQRKRKEEKKESRENKGEDREKKGKEMQNGSCHVFGS